MPKNKGNAAGTPGPRLRSTGSLRPCPRPPGYPGRSDLPFRCAGTRLQDTLAVWGLGEELGSYYCLPVWSHWGGADAIFVGPPAGECGLLLPVRARLTAARYGPVGETSLRRPGFRK